MPRRGLIFILLGLVLAIFTGGFVFVLLQQQATSASTGAALPPTPVPTKKVPVATRLLSLGTTITDTDIITREVPEDLQLVGVLTDTDELVGQTVVEPIQQDEFFRTAQLASGRTGPLSKQVAEGRVVMAFPVEDLLNKTKMLREGDRVDLLMTLDVREDSANETREGKVSTVTLQNINVFRIVRDQPTDENAAPEPKALLFDMTPQDAVVAKFIKDSGGTMDFVLRSPMDKDTFKTDPINQDYLFDNYNLRAPRSSARPKQQ